MSLSISSARVTAKRGVSTRQTVAGSPVRFAGDPFANPAPLIRRVYASVAYRIGDGRAGRPADRDCKALD